MHILLFGDKGLLGQALVDVFKDEDLVAVDRDEIDISDEPSLQKFCREVGPEIIVNAAANNAVDEVEKNPEAAKVAFAVNAEALNNLSEAALLNGAMLVHFSTDYVFDGAKGSPYVEDDPPRPISVYGRSKHEGEQAIIKQSSGGLRYYLIRTSRLFGKAPDRGTGKKTFVDIVLDLAGENYELQFIDDEIASPTYVGDLAAAVKELLVNQPAFGIYHRTNDGSCSWYQFAKAALDNSRDFTTIPNSSLGKQYIKLIPVERLEKPRPARRPAYSVLQSTKLAPLRHWQEALRDYMIANHL